MCNTIIIPGNWWPSDNTLGQIFPRHRTTRQHTLAGIPSTHYMRTDLLILKIMLREKKKQATLRQVTVTLQYKDLSAIGNNTKKYIYVDWTHATVEDLICSQNSKLTTFVQCLRYSSSNKACTSTTVVAGPLFCKEKMSVFEFLLIRYGDEYHTLQKCKLPHYCLHVLWTCGVSKSHRRWSPNLYFVRTQISEATVFVVWIVYLYFLTPLVEYSR